MNTEFQVSKCKKCGSILSEPKHEERTPCPVCGEMKRIHDEALIDGIAVYDHMRIKGKHDGKEKPFFDARAGADFYFKEKKWRHLERTIDRDNKLYVEIIKDMKTGKIIKEEREPLPEHQGHGAAKQKQVKP